MLKSGQDAVYMRDKAKEQALEVEETNVNLLAALERTRELKAAYRSLALFYKNTETDKVKNISIMNTAPEQLRDLDNILFIDRVSDELKQNFDRLDTSVETTRFLLCQVT